MKQYLQGASCITTVIVVTAVVGFGARLFLSSDALVALIGGTFLVGVISLGYVYKRWNGPLLFAADGKAHVRLFPFLFGVGTVLGPVKIILGPFPIPDATPLANLLLLVSSVPLAGASAFGGMLIGSVFCKRGPMSGRGHR